ncbi:MAG: hypothetical protein VCF25_00210 [Candidatus Poribacteria bacterium]
MNSSPTPLSPKHPQLSVDAPHAFFPIYIGYCPHCPVDEMGTSNSPICIWNYQSSAFAIWTKILYLSTISQRSKCHSVLRITFRHNALGKDAWGYSGFFHLRVLGYVLPYPSTFSMALTFMTLPIYARLMKDRNRMWLIPIIASTVTVLLTHPITFIFLAVGILSLSMADPSFSWRKYSLLAGFFFLVMFLGVLWPYCPVIQLLGSESKAYHPSNRVKYSSFIRRILPVLIGVLVLLVRIRLSWRDSLGMMLILLIFIFACG